MKIVIIVTCLKRGGAERVATVLANELSLKGDQVAIIKFDSGENAYVLNNNVQCISVQSNRFTGCLRIANRLLLLKKKIRSLQPEVILCFSSKTAVYPLILYSKRPFPVIMSERSNPFYEYANMNGFKKVIRRIIDRFILPTADGFIFLTKESTGYYNGIIRNKSIVIPNGLFADDIPDQPVRFEERNQKKICAVANLRKVKDYDTMLRSFALFHETHPTFELYILGEGPERQHLLGLIELLNITEHVHMLGEVERPVEFIKDAGVFLSTSKSESWSNGILEAMACGVPCISTDCDFGPRAMITNELNGLLVEVGNTTAICKAMERVVNDHVFAKYLSDNAIKVRVEYEKRKIIDMYSKYIMYVVNTKRERSQIK